MNISRNVSPQFTDRVYETLLQNILTGLLLLDNVHQAQHFAFVQN